MFYCPSNFTWPSHIKNVYEMHIMKKKKDKTKKSNQKFHISKISPMFFFKVEEHSDISQSFNTLRAVVPRVASSRWTAHSC